MHHVARVPHVVLLHTVGSRDLELDFIVGLWCMCVCEVLYDYVYLIMYNVFSIKYCVKRVRVIHSYYVTVSVSIRLNLPNTKVESI